VYQPATLTGHMLRPLLLRRSLFVHDGGKCRYKSRLRFQGLWPKWEFPHSDKGGVLAARNWRPETAGMLSTQHSNVCRDLAKFFETQTCGCALCRSCLMPDAAVNCRLVCVVRYFSAARAGRKQHQRGRVLRWCWCAHDGSCALLRQRWCVPRLHTTRRRRYLSPPPITASCRAHGKAKVRWPSPRSEVL